MMRPRWCSSSRDRGLLMINRVVTVASLFLSVALGLAFGQFELGSVVGTVKDPTGLPVANAAVEIRSVATNATRQTTTSAGGEFDFVALQPGSYEVSVKQQGFKETTQKFELVVGQRRELQIGLEVGSSTQSVTVTGTAVAVEAASS